MSAILKFDFQKRKQLRYSQVNYLNYTKRPNFACDNYVSPKTRGNKIKQCTHSTSLYSANLAAPLSAICHDVSFPNDSTFLT